MKIQEKVFRSTLYHKNVPGGQVFTDEAEFNQSLQNGWVEAPWLVNEVIVVDDVHKEKTKVPIRKPITRKK